MDLESAKQNYSQIKIIFDNYLILVLQKDTKQIDITVRDTLSMEIYQAKNFKLQKLNIKALETALRKSKKEIQARFSQTKCENQQILQIKIIIQMPFIPKTTQTIYIPKIKKLTEQQITNQKLYDIKNKIIQCRKIVSDATQKIGKLHYIHKQQFHYCQSGIKLALCSLNLPVGKYLIIISALIKTNASNYISPSLTKADICPGTYYGTPADSQMNPFGYLVRSIVQITSDNELIEFSATNGQSYGFTTYNLIMTAERLGD